MKVYLIFTLRYFVAEFHRFEIYHLLFFYKCPKNILEHNNFIYIYKWPSRSPDLSGVENVWPLLQKSVVPTSDENVVPVAVAEIRIRKFFKDFPRSECRKYLESMLGRVQRCRDKDFDLISWAGSVRVLKTLFESVYRAWGVILGPSQPPHTPKFCLSSYEGSPPYIVV